MPDEYIDFPIETDENQLYQIGVARIQNDYPNWNPAPGSLADLTLRTCASMAAVGAENASNVKPDIFRYYGKLAQLLPIDGTPAVATVRFEVQDTAGYSIPAFTPVGLKTDSMPDPVGFQTLIELDIPNGTSVGDIDVTAFEVGAINNGLNIVSRADTLSYVTAVSLVTAADKGVDPELTEDYLNRLSRELETWTKTPITEDNFAALAPSIPGIYRCAARENYNPDDDTTDNEKFVALCPIDVDGNDVSSAVATALETFMESLREVNFRAPVTNSTRNSIDVSYTAHIWSAFDAVTAEAAIDEALVAFINPASWGMPSSLFRVPSWKNTPTIRHSLVVQAIQNALASSGWAENIEIGISGGTMAAADLDLIGAFPLPSIGTITPTTVVES